MSRYLETLAWVWAELDAERWDVAGELSDHDARSTTLHLRPAPRTPEPLKAHVTIGPNGGLELWMRNTVTDAGRTLTGADARATFARVFGRLEQNDG